MQLNKSMKYLSPLICGGLAMQLLVIDSYAKRDWIGFQNWQWSGFKIDNDRYNKLMIEVERYNSIM